MINNKQRKLTEKLLFDYYMISSKYENYIYCDKPFYIENKVFEKFKKNACIINNLNNKILKGIRDEHSEVFEYLEDFPLREKILNLKRDIYHTFWTRFDGFIKENKEVFFSEFNYDKPCGEREIMATGAMNAIGNVNKDFIELFIENIKINIKEIKCEKANINIGILVDPAHYEEAHISYLLKEIIEENINYVKVISFGPKNPTVTNEKLKVFNEYIHIVIKLYPTEYLSEVNDIEKILEIYDKGNLIILNDPRVIILQAKSYFAYLWHLVENKSFLITKDEIQAIKDSIPKTWIYSSEKNEELLINKDKYLLKPLLGRYSEDIYIGLENSIEEWEKIILNINSLSKKFVIQEFIKIKKDKTFLVSDNLGTMPINGYGNFGVFINKDSFSGICLRWSTEYVTRDDTTWITPVGVKDKPYKIIRSNKKEEIFKKIRDRALVEYNFTGSYNGSMQYISTDYLEINNQLYEEVLNVANKFAQILKKTQKVIIDNIGLFRDIMNFDDNIADLITKQYTDALCFIGRMDIVIDNENNIKILEFNAETPAGLVEAIGIQQIIKEELKISNTNINKKLSFKIKENIKRIIGDYNKVKNINTIGILSTSYFEDWYNTEIIYNLFKELGYDVVRGNINDTKIENGHVSLYGRKFDAVYRYYPLDWIAEDDVDFLKAFKENTLSINPPHTIVTQNKSIFAVIYELNNQGFYTNEEKDFIEKYVPKSYLENNKILESDFCIKHILSREGNDIDFSYSNNELISDNCIYQERIDICDINLDVNKGYKIDNKINYPILGIYMVDTEACGIYTRVGELITNKWSSFVSTFIKK